MKTILFPIFQGVVARNLLRTDFFSGLSSRPDIKIVLIVTSEEKKRYYAKEFSSPNVIFEVAPVYKTPSLQSLFTFLKYNLLNTKRMDVRRRIYLHESKNIFGYLFKLCFNRLFSWQSIRRLVRKLDMYLVKDENYLELFDKYQTNLVISAHPFGDSEASLIRQAKKRGIKTVAIINSWDKLTSRSILRVLPDKMVVHNEIIKKEAIDNADMDESNIVVTGVPHYDFFVNCKPRSKEFFYSKFGIDLQKKIILFCPTGQYYSNNDIDIIKNLVLLQKSGEIGPNIQIFVRFPPNDTVSIPKEISDEGLILYQPGIRFSSKRGLDWDMNAEDIQLLFDNVYWSSVVICPPSSLSIDAAILDRPIINIKFGDDKRYSTDNINLYYSSDHYSHILKHNGIKIVKDPDELATQIITYLHDPDSLCEGRKAIASEQCYKMDGRSSERLLNFIEREL